VETGTLGIDVARRVEELAKELDSGAAETIGARFIHDDVSPMNIMCTTAGELLAIIDWGDAGWGDPTLDFAAMPLGAVPAALAGHEEEAPGLLGAFPEARVAWHKLTDAVDDLLDTSGQPPDLEALRQLLRSRTSRRITG